MIQQIVSGVLRTILLSVGGAQVGQGWLTNDQLQQIVGAVLTLIAVGWQIVAAARRRTQPGGPYNPRAEVRRAQPAQPAARPRRPWSPDTRPRGGDGCARLPVMGAIAATLLLTGLLYGCVAWAQSRAPWRVERTETWPDIIAEQPDLTHYLRQTPRPSPREDGRPFLVRLCASLRLAPKQISLHQPIRLLYITGGADF